MDAFQDLKLFLRRCEMVELFEFPHDEESLKEYRNRLLQVNDVDVMEAQFVHSISFVPSPQDVDFLLRQSTKAQSLMNGKSKSNLLSKMLIKNAPASPSESVLVQFYDAAKSVVLNDCLSVMPNRDAPLTNNSMGPNGVLLKFEDDKYGSKRINLFHNTLEETVALMHDYLTLRNFHKEAIFANFVNSMKETAEQGLVVSENAEYTIEQFNSNYALVRALFRRVQNSLGDRKLEDFGIDVRSFCQTWMRQGYPYRASVYGPACFSVFSPHFQTRFYIRDANKLKQEAYKEDERLFETHISAYKFVTKYLLLTMLDEYGISNSGGPAFVNMDDFYQMCV